MQNEEVVTTNPQGVFGLVVLGLIVYMLMTLGSTLNKAQADYNKVKTTQGVK